jgi:hypothetical protein
MQPCDEASGVRHGPIVTHARPNRRGHTLGRRWQPAAAVCDSGRVSGTGLRTVALVSRRHVDLRRVASAACPGR